MVVETIIFIGIFIGAIATGVISTWGWIKSEDRNVKLAEENYALLRELAEQGSELVKVKAENGFYKLQLKNKE